MMKTRERKTGQVILLSILCFVLIVLLGAGVLTSLSLRRAAQERVLTAAVEKFPMEEITVNGSSAAQFILDTFIADERVSIENVERVMQEGTFSAFAAEIMDRYNAYLTDGGELPKINPDDFVRLIEENQELIRQETGLEFLAPDKEKLRENLEAPLDAWNTAMRESLSNGISGFTIKATVSLWVPIILGVLLLGIMIWMVMFYVRGGFRAGTALKVYSVALFVPCAVMLGGLFLTDLIAAANIPFIKDSMGMLYDTLLPIAGIASGVCVLIFIIGIVCTLVSAKLHPVSVEYDGGYDGLYAQEDAGYDSEPDFVPEYAEPETAEPEMKRQYCRNCGQPLVNPDARFCYKCGNVQEAVKHDDE